MIAKDAPRYEVTAELSVPGQGGTGYGQGYYFYVSGCVLGHPGYRLSVGPIYPWVRERAGWPKLLPEMSVCAPSVVYLPGSGPDDSYAIFAATDRIYAWRPDGSKPSSCGRRVLRPGFVPSGSGTDSPRPWHTGTGIFRARPAANLLNLRGEGTYFVGIRSVPGNPHCRTSQFLCKGTQSSGASPIIGAELDAPWGHLRDLPVLGRGTGTSTFGDEDLNNPDGDQSCEGTAFATPAMRAGTTISP